jgi:hypothetical protein
MMEDEVKKPVHERLAEELMERLRQGVIPRQRDADELGACAALNLIDGKGHGHANMPQRPAKQSIHEQRVQGWTGLMKIKGAVKRDGVVRWAEDMGVEPDFYRMYAQTKDNAFEWLCDYSTEQQAKNMADRLAGIFSMMSSEDTRRLTMNGARKATPLSTDTSANSAAGFLQIMLDRQRRLHRDP